MAPVPSYASLTATSLVALPPSLRTFVPGRRVRCLPSYTVRFLCGVAAGAAGSSRPGARAMRNRRSASSWARVRWALSIDARPPCSAIARRM